MSYNDIYYSCKRGNEMKVYVVLGDDRGCGVSVAGVFLSLEAALEFVKENSHCYLYSEYGMEVVE